jgi:head-tail adaptor
MTRIQDLRNRVVLLKRHVTEEQDGSFTERWEKGTSVWAKVLPSLGREAFGEEWNTVNPAQTKFKVTMRLCREKFTRLQWDDLTLALLCPPLIDQNRRWMVCLMYEVEQP